MAETSRTKFNDSRRKRFLDLLRNGLRRGAAARTVGLDRSTVYRHMQADPEFAEAVDDAEMDAHEIVEDALFQAAKGGNVVACQVWLYNRCPERWADRRRLDVNAAVGLRDMSEAELAERERLLGLPVGPIDASDLEGEVS